MIVHVVFGSSIFIKNLEYLRYQFWNLTLEMWKTSNSLSFPEFMIMGFCHEGFESEKVKKRRGLLNVLKKGEVKKIRTFKSPQKSKCAQKCI